MKGILNFIGVIVLLIAFFFAIEEYKKVEGSSAVMVDDEKGHVSKTEKHLNDRILSIESGIWNKDSIRNLEMDINLHFNQELISRSSKVNFLSLLESSESISLQKTFKKEIATSCSNINQTIKNRIKELSVNRPSDSELKSMKQAIYHLGQKKVLRNKIDKFLGSKWEYANQQQLYNVIQKHLNFSLIKNCGDVTQLREELIKKLSGFEAFHKLFEYKFGAKKLKANQDAIELKNKITKWHDYQKPSEFRDYSYYENRFVEIRDSLDNILKTW
tara:strand:+ start:1660 stop:2478 length:819 start_codon:yes stop_codon:yes gene_type:complete